MKKPNKATFVFNLEWADAISGFSDAIQLEIYKMIVAYARTGEMPDNASECAKMAFAFIKGKMDENNARYEAKCEKLRKNGRVGGIANGSKWKQMEANASKCYQMEANGSKWKQIESDNDYDNDSSNNATILPPNDNNLSYSTNNLNYHHIPPQGEGGVGEARKIESQTDFVKDQKAEAFEKEKSSAKKEKDWRTDFALYQEQAYKAYSELRQNREWIAEREKFNPNVNVELSLEKAYAEYWGTEAGWKKKKQSRSTVIDWRRTYTNAISMNKVYKPRGTPVATGVENYHVELNNKTKF